MARTLQGNRKADFPEMPVFRSIAIAAVLALAAAAPASAVTYDAFSSFTGTQGAGNFLYGRFNTNTETASFFSFSNTVHGNSGCAIAGSVCLQDSGNSDVPGVYKSLATSFQYGSVNVPNDRLLLHPGNGVGEAVFVAFLAPVAGTYNFSGSFSVLDNSPTGVGLLRAGTDSFTTLGALAAPGDVFSFTSFVLRLAQGDVLGLIVTNGNGVHGNDSTGVNFSASLVPEPATWGLMIAGFALVGATARRRRAVAA